MIQNVYYSLLFTLCSKFITTPYVYFRVKPPLKSSSGTPGSPVLSVTPGPPGIPGTPTLPVIPGSPGTPGRR